MKTGATSSNNPTPCVATIGFFDGVHLGHRYLIRQTQEVAARLGVSTTVVTFRTHPRQVMQPGFRPQLLTTGSEKEMLLKATGIDRCLTMEFTRELAQLTARQFMERLRQEQGVEALVIGYDHRFGHGRSEGFDDYVRYGSELGMEVSPAQAYRLADGASISSSRLRRLLQEGDVEEAARELGYAYFLSGTVVNGHRIGRTLGYPTANLQVTDPCKLIPAIGVYAVQVSHGREHYAGMLSIGHRPTVANGPECSIEVHLLDFSGDLYGQTLTLTFVRRLRSEQRFDSLAQLADQLRHDEAATRACCADFHPIPIQKPTHSVLQRDHDDMCI